MRIDHQHIEAGSPPSRAFAADRKHAHLHEKADG